MRKYILILLIFISYFGLSQTSPTYENITIRNQATIRQKAYFIPTISAPAIPLEGMLYADTDGYLYYYTGVAWVTAISQWTLTGSDIQNNNAGKVILPGDSTFFDVMPDVGDKVGRILHVNQYKEIEIITPTSLGDRIDSGRAASPTAYTTWIRGTNNLYPANTADTVRIYANLKLPLTTATTGIIYKGQSRFIHDYGTGQTFTGYNAGNFTMTGNYNSAFGGGAFAANTTGAYNVAVGHNSMYSNTEGGYNVAVGQGSLGSNLTGSSNVAVGQNSMYYNDVGTGNVAVGENSLLNNTLGGTNISIGRNSTRTATGTSCNVAVGTNSLYTMTLGFDNIAIGTNAMQFLTEGYKNTGIGTEVYQNLTTGNTNVAIGDSSGYRTTTADGQIWIGYNSGNNSKFATLDSVGGIDNGNTTRPLLYFNFKYDSLIAYGDLRTTKNLNIPVTSTDLIGSIQQNGTYFIHSYGTENFFSGIGAGNFTLTGTDNTAVGYYAGHVLSSGDYSTLIGNSAGAATTTGEYNTAMGWAALQTNIAGHGNTVMGYYAGRIAKGSYNTYIGYQSAFGGGTGTAASNTAVGENSMFSVTTGGYNTSIGRQSLYLNATGTNNVAVGMRAGWFETGSKKLYIANDSTQWANGAAIDGLLIYGDYDLNFINIFNRVSIGSAKNPTSALDVTGNVAISGLIKSGTGAVADNDATPDVSGYNTFIYVGTANSVAPTDLDNPVVGAYYTFIGNSDTYTLNFPGSANFKMSGAGKNLGQYDNITFYCQADNLYIMVGYNDITP